MTRPLPRPVFRPPLFDPPVDAPAGIRETPTVAFADLVRMMAEAVADAQTRLDRSSAELVAELAATPVQVVPSVTETIGADGSVTYTTGEARTVSLLELGITPTFYQFSQTVIETVMDLKIVETETTTTEGKSRRIGLFADTATVRGERKLNRDVTISSKLTTTLVPVPMPLRLEPTRAVTTAEPS